MPCYEKSTDQHQWSLISVEEIRNTACTYYENPDEVVHLLKKGVVIRMGAVNIRIKKAADNTQ